MTYTGAGKNKRGAGVGRETGRGAEQDTGRGLGLGTKRDSAQRNTGRGTSATPWSPARGTAARVKARPILIDIDNPEWADEARLVAAVTGRESLCLDADGLGGGRLVADRERDEKHGIERETMEELVGERGAIVLTDKDEQWPRLPGLTVHRVDQLTPDLSHGGNVELAELIGTEDPLRIAVVGAHGGAGTSVFATGLAATLGQAQARDALVVDRDPHSQGLATVLGIENQPGWDSEDPGTRVSEEQLLRNCAEIDGVHVLGRSGLGARLQARTRGEELTLEQLCRAAHRAVMVVDCGRMGPGSDEWEQQWGDVVPDAIVIVGLLSVAGVAAVRDMSFRCWESRGRGRVFYVVRRQARGATTPAMAAALLEGNRAITWEYDEIMAYDMDRGALSLSTRRLVKATSAVAQQITDVLEREDGYAA